MKYILGQTDVLAIWDENNVSRIYYALMVDYF